MSELLGRLQIFWQALAPRELRFWATICGFEDKSINLKSYLTEEKQQDKRNSKDTCCQQASEYTRPVLARQPTFLHFPEIRTVVFKS